MSFDFTKKDALVDAARREPPPALRALSPFEGPAAYRDKLVRALAAPDAYWREEARRIDLLDDGPGKRGTTVLRAMRSLNLAQRCLAPLRARPPEGGVILEVRDDDGDDVVTLAMLEATVGAIAARVRELGLEPGAAVMIAASADHRMIAATLACLHLGLAVVPIARAAVTDRLAGVYRAAGCRALLSTFDAGSPAAEERTVRLDRPLAPAALDAPVEASADAAALVFADLDGGRFTIPAGGFLLQATAAYRDLLGGTGFGSPLWMLGGRRTLTFLAAALGAMACGDPVGLVVAEQSGDPARLRGALERAHAVRLLADVGAIAGGQGGVEEGEAQYEGRALALLILEGEGILPADWRAARGALAGADTHMIQVLARPEAGGFIAGPCPLVSPVREASVGMAAPGVDLCVANRSGEICPVGIGGFLALSSPIPALALELANARVPILLDVKARRDSSGDLWTMGEAEVARAAGPGVSLSELETVIAEVRGVDQVAVVRYEEQDGTTRTRAFVKLDEGFEESAVLGETAARISSRLGDAAVPDSFQRVAQLPRSRSGKLLRSVLRRVSAGEPLGAEDVAMLTEPSVIEELTK